MYVHNLERVQKLKIGSIVLCSTATEIRSRSVLQDCFAIHEVNTLCSPGGPVSITVSLHQPESRILSR